jgi:undecaprenyl-diphosphatase
MLRISPARLDRLIAWDHRCTRLLHRAAGHEALVRLLALVSRLADGGIWYPIILAVALGPHGAGLECAARMVASGAAGVLIVHWMKRRTCRMRPYECLGDVRLCVRALDRFSFPSGHTLHAVSFTLILGAFYPAIALLLLLPFTALVALSRVVLGLHYPTDVLAGACIGAMLGLAALSM